MTHATENTQETFSQEMFEAMDISIEEGIRRGHAARAEAFADAGRYIAAVIERMFEKQNTALDLLRRNKKAHAVR